MCFLSSYLVFSVPICSKLRAPALGCASMYLMATGQELSVYVEAMRETGWMLPIAKMAVAGPLVYHFMTGVRHIVRCIVGDA